MARLPLLGPPSQVPLLEEGCPQASLWKEASFLLMTAPLDPRGRNKQ